MTKTNAERQKKWRDSHKDRKLKANFRYRAHYNSYNNYMDDWEDHLHYLYYRELSNVPYHPSDTIWAGNTGWKVISVNDRAGQLWLKKNGYRNNYDDL